MFFLPFEKEVKQVVITNIVILIGTTLKVLEKA